MTPTEAARLAAAIAILRPGWPAPSLRTFLTDERHSISKRPYQDAATAMAYVACDPDSKTPARVLEAGPWWSVGRPEPRPPTVEWCGTCRDEHYPNQPCVRQGPPAAMTRRQQHAAELRAAWDETHRQLCSHGVLPRDCIDHWDQPEETA